MHQASIWILPDIYRVQGLDFGLDFSNLLNAKGGQCLHIEGSETLRARKTRQMYPVLGI